MSRSQQTDVNGMQWCLTAACKTCCTCRGVWHNQVSSIGVGVAAASPFSLATCTADRLNALHVLPCLPAHGICACKRPHSYKGKGTRRVGHQCCIQRAWGAPERCWASGRTTGLLQAAAPPPGWLHLQWQPGRPCAALASCLPASWLLPLLLHLRTPCEHPEACGGCWHVQDRQGAGA